MLYVSVVHKTSKTGDTTDTSEHRKTHTRVAVPCLFTLGQSPAGCFCALLSAAETDSVSGRQMRQRYRKAFGDLVAFEGGFRKLSFW
jgi:hypothetical protein